MEKQKNPRRDVFHTSASVRDQQLSSCFQDLHKVEAKLHEKRLKEKGEEERQKRIAAKLKEKVHVQ